MMGTSSLGSSSRAWILTAALVLASPVASVATEPCTKAATHVANSEDRRTTAEVQRRIAEDDTVSPLAHEVKVTTTEGVVTLHGVVVDDEDRVVLASLAESAPGVRRVDDRLLTRR